MPAFLVPFRFPLLLTLACALAAPAPTFGRQERAAGAIDVDVTLPTRPATRQADRYVSSTGEARNTQDVPAVVYIAGPVAGAPEARPSGLELAQRGEAFRPTMVVVPVGARVTFPNGDNLFHNVFSYSRPKRFDLGRYPRGEAKTVVFDKPGYVKVLCEVHKWMRAGVLVVDNPYYAVVEASGRVKLDGVPPGRYTLVLETFDRRAQAIVDVAPGVTARVTLAP
jgi:plastocyanin